MAVGQRRAERAMADFYLGGGQGFDFTSEPRACTILGAATAGKRTDGLLVAVEPPLPGERFGYSGLIDKVILFLRHKGVRLSDVGGSEPVVVNIHLPDEHEPNRPAVGSKSQYAILDWGLLFPSEHDARTSIWRYPL